MEKSKTYPFIEIECVKFLIKVAYNPDTMRVGIRVVREWRDLIAAKGKQHYAENKDTIRARHKKWREANKDQIAARTKKDRSEAPEKFAARYKNWAQANPDKRKVSQKERRVYLSVYKDCKKLNQWFPSCDAHHVEPDVMMHVPPTLHQSIWHSLKTGHGMEEINRLAFDWLNGVRRESHKLRLRRSSNR